MLLLRRTAPRPENASCSTSLAASLEQRTFKDRSIGDAAPTPARGRAPASRPRGDAHRRGDAAAGATAPPAGQTPLPSGLAKALMRPNARRERGVRTGREEEGSEAASGLGDLRANAVKPR